MIYIIYPQSLEEYERVNDILKNRGYQVSVASNYKFWVNEAFFRVHSEETPRFVYVFKRRFNKKAK